MKNIFNKIKTIFRYKKPSILVSPTKKVNVQSSAIRAVEYDEQTKDLFVDFTKGTKYRYSEVKAEDFYNLVSSESVGKEFVASIRNSYEFEKIEEKK